MLNFRERSTSPSPSSHSPSQTQVAPTGTTQPRRGGPRSRREARGRYNDPLRDHRAIVGRDVRTPWYIRVRALLVLLVIVVGLGMALAGGTLLIIASGRFLLEILAG